MHAARLILIIASMSIMCSAAEPPSSSSTTSTLRPLGECTADLGSSDLLTRLRAARDIAHHGTAAAEAVDVLLPLLDAQERPLRESAATALTAAGETVLPPLLRSLPELTPLGQQAALQVICNLRDAAPAEAASGVWALSKSSDEEVVRSVGETLVRLGPRSAALVPQLVSTAFDESQPTTPAADAARRALGGLGPDFYRTLPLLAERLRQPVSGEVLLNIEDLLSAVYPQSPPEKEQEIVSALVELARNPSQVVHRHAMLRLSRLGERAASAVPELEEIVRDRDAASTVRYHAVRCLTKIVCPKGAATIIALRDVDSPAVRAAVVISLAELGRATPMVRQALAALAEDENDKVASLAKRVLEAPERPR